MNKDKKVKDKTRNNIFAAAVDYLKRIEYVKTQKEIAALMGVTSDTVSRIITAKTKVTDDAITKLQTASGCVFNLQWLRGESKIMLAKDLEKAEKAETTKNRQQSTQMPDYGSMTNAIIAAKDDAIEALKREIATKDKLVETLKQQVADLHATIAILQRKEGLGSFSFNPGVSEEGRKTQV